MLYYNTVYYMFIIINVYPSIISPKARIDPKQCLRVGVETLECLEDQANIVVRESSRVTGSRMLFSTPSDVAIRDSVRAQVVRFLLVITVKLCAVLN
jgi:hypothetical protein